MAGFSPFILWEIFSIIYYGFPFPNTYYAKLHAGIPLGEMFAQGCIYYLDSLNLDPLTLGVILSGFVIVWSSKDRRCRALSVGVMLYLLYILRIGGDFMTGRHFAAPLVLSVILISRSFLFTGWGRSLVPLAIVVTIGFMTPRSPLWSDKEYGANGEGGISEQGIADERAFYYLHTGLLTVLRGEEQPSHHWCDRGRTARLSHTKVRRLVCVGFDGFSGGPDVHNIDALALTEPLLARLPTYMKLDWRIGHLSRTFPAGYMKTLEIDTNVIENSSLAQYYDKLSHITRGEIWNIERLGEIWKMNTGAYDYLLDIYLDPRDTIMGLAEICEPKVHGSKWNSEGTVIVRSAGVLVILDSTYVAPSVEISVDHNDQYRVVFLKDSLEMGHAVIESEFIDGGGLRVDTIQVPNDAVVVGYNAIRVYPYTGDDRYSVGHVRIL